MKRIVILLAVVLTALTSKINAQAIVGGSGRCLTSGNPNSVTSIQNGFVLGYNCTEAYDTVNNIHYALDRTAAAGQKWKVITLGSPFNTSLALNTAQDSLQVTDAGGVKGLPKIAIAPVQSVVGSGDITVTNSGGTYTVSYTDGDKSATNELQTLSTASNTVTLSNSGGSFTVAGAGINTVATSGTTITVTATEVDGSVTNEGSLTVGAGTSTTSLISSNTSGSTDVTIEAGTGLSISETGNKITLSFASLTAYDNDAAAAAAGVAIGAMYKASKTNTMGMKAGTIMTREY